MSAILGNLIVTKNIYLKYDIASYLPSITRPVLQTVLSLFIKLSVNLPLESLKPLHF